MTNVTSQVFIHAMRRQRVWAHPQTQQCWDNIVPGFSNYRFIRNFRMSRESFNYICRRLRRVLQRQTTNYSLPIPVNKRVAIALWRLATNNDYRSVSHLFGVGIATVCRCVQEFCCAVLQVLLPDHIKTPDAMKLMEMATYFDNRWRAPQCVGAIDGSHIPIVAPQVFPRDFYNRKGWHSIILQGVVDGRGLFWDVCVGFPGSVHDARVLKQSHLWEVVHNGQFFSQHNTNICGREVGHYLIGDPAYPLQPWLVKPFSDPG